ncbi:MAG: class I SAM-dependent methyltransferase, partial [Verrucomicrobia bacterium]|nr:class I SAM-dependent methyltransferase [Verrucomicrobiota bacterium]
MNHQTRRAITAFLIAFCFGTFAKGDTSREILDATGIQGGLIVHVGCGDGKLTAALRANDSFIVHGLDADAKNVEAARKHIQSLGLYGKVSAGQWDGKRLPYADNLVNLIVTSGECRVTPEEMLRVLAPNGVVLDARHPSPVTLRKPWPKEIDEWPQHFHGADNNAVARDSVVGPPRRFQWIAEPQWSRSHLGLPSVTSMVSSKGRLFDIEDQASAEHPSLP